MNLEITDLEHRISKRAAWTFSTTADQWQHDTLAQLVSGLEKFTSPDPAQGLVATIEKRLSFAKSVYKLSVEDHRKEWDLAIASIKNRSTCPMYGGLEISPQSGPRAAWPRSGLGALGVRSP